MINNGEYSMDYFSVYKSTVANTTLVFTRVLAMNPPGRIKLDRLGSGAHSFRGPYNTNFVAY